MLRENDDFEIESINELVTNTIDMIDEGDVEVDKKIATDVGIQQQLGKAIFDKSSMYNTIKDKPGSSKDVEKIVKDVATIQAGNNAAAETAGGDSDKIEKAEDTINDIKAKIGESDNYRSNIISLINQGYSLKEARHILSDDNEDDYIADEDDYLLDEDGYNSYDAFDDEYWDEDEIDIAEDDEMEDNTTNIDDSTWDLLYQECTKFLEEGKEEFEQLLADKFDVSIEEVEDVIIEAMRDYIGSDLEEVDDEVSEEFEREIDQFDGDGNDEEDLLSHLTLKFELSPKDVELIRSSSEDLVECVISMAELVRKRRKS
jgi:hypothetical protein